MCGVFQCVCVVHVRVRAFVCPILCKYVPACKFLCQHTCLRLCACASACVSVCFVYVYICLRMYARGCEIEMVLLGARTAALPVCLLCQCRCCKVLQILAGFNRTYIGTTSLLRVWECVCGVFLCVCVVHVRMRAFVRPLLCKYMPAFKYVPAYLPAPVCVRKCLMSVCVVNLCICLHMYAHGCESDVVLLGAWTAALPVCLLCQYRCCKVLLFSYAGSNSTYIATTSIPAIQMSVHPIHFYNKSLCTHTRAGTHAGTKCTLAHIRSVLDVRTHTRTCTTHTHKLHSHTHILSLSHTHTHAHTHTHTHCVLVLWAGVIRFNLHRCRLNLQRKPLYCLQS